MFSWMWSKRPDPQKSRESRKLRFLPTVGQLEDRTAPSVSNFLGSLSFLKPASGPADHLEIITPANVQAGKTFSIIVKAETASNQIATGYTGTVHFSIPADAGASVPADYTFVPRDRGVRVFQVTLSTAGTQIISANDLAISTIADDSSTNVTPAPVASQFLVKMPTQTTAGVPTYVSIAVKDASGQVVPNYTGTIGLTSTDGAATLPADYTFTAADRGVHTFQVTFNTAGSQSLTATDVAQASVIGKSTTTVNAVGIATRFSVVTLGVGAAGYPTALMVVALDANNRVVTGYTGTVRLTSTDAAALLPADYTFIASDRGAHVFTVNFNTTGKQTVTATDTTATTVLGSATVKIAQRWIPRGWWW